MAKDANIEVVEAKAEAIETKKYKVLKEFTLDKLYKVGSYIELPNGKTKDNLISNKFIK